MGRKKGVLGPVAVDAGVLEHSGSLAIVVLVGEWGFELVHLAGARSSSLAGKQGGWQKADASL